MVSKKLSKVLLVIYSLILIWILLFKLRLSFSSIAASLEHPMRSLNLVPFQGSTIVNGEVAINEIISNALIFAPLGVILGISEKNSSLIKKLAFILLLSLFIEGMQFVLGIGATDVTDIIMNFSGGFIGLLIYQGLKLVVPEAKLDKWLVRIGTAFGILCFGLVMFMLFVNR